MAGIPWGSIIQAGGGLLAGLLDDSEEESNKTYLQAAQLKGQYAYPGQKKIARSLAPYLWENVNMGLSESEKRLMRGAGRTSIMQGIRDSIAKGKSIYAGQGLRGGAVARALSGISESRVPQLAKLETDISAADIKARKERVTDILKFLALSAGYGEDDVSSPSVENTGIVSNTLNSYWDSGGVGNGVAPIGGGGYIGGSIGFSGKGAVQGGLVGLSTAGIVGAILGALGGGLIGGSTPGMSIGDIGNDGSYGGESGDVS